MKYCNVAVVMPITELSGNEQELQSKVWTKTSELLLPSLGKLYRQFNPASNAWGHPIRNPLGVVLGKQEPELFLALFLAAQKRQMEATAFHAEAMIEKTDLSKAQTVGDSLLCPIVADGSDPELMVHTLWHLSMHRGDLLPDCGIYYTHLGRAVASLEEQRQVLSRPSDYALCMVMLSPEVKKDAGVQ